MYSFIKYLIPAAISSFTFATALEVSDLNMELTRSQADTTLTKDYEYAVMEDLMVRRTWSEDERRTIKVDFDPKSDQLKSIIIEYKTPVSLKFASRDILQITKAPRISWRKLPSNRADKYGINRARAAKVDGAYILLDTDDNDKCLYIILTPEKPDDAPRTSLAEVDLADSGETAMGSRQTSSYAVAKSLMDDEEKRHMQTNDTDESTSFEAEEESTPATTTRITIRTTAPKAKKTAPVAVSAPEEPATPERESATTPPIRKNTLGENIEDGVSDFVEEQGLDEIPPMYYAIGGGALILLFIIIGAIRRKAQAKKIAAQAERLRRNPHLAGASIKSKRRH